MISQIKGMKALLSIALVLACSLSSLADDENMMTLEEAVKSDMVIAIFKGLGASSGDSIKVQLRRTASAPDGPITVKVEPGTLLRPMNYSVQSMVIDSLGGELLEAGRIQSRSTMTLESDSSPWYVLEAYCAELEKKNPGSDIFLIEGTNLILKQVLEQAQKKRLDIRETQAAIWIVTDGASANRIRKRGFRLSDERWKRAQELIESLRARDAIFDEPIVLKASDHRPDARLVWISANAGGSGDQLENLSDLIRGAVKFDPEGVAQIAIRLHQENNSPALLGLLKGFSFGTENVVLIRCLTELLHNNDAGVRKGAIAQLNFSIAGAFNSPDLSGFGEVDVATVDLLLEAADMSEIGRGTVWGSVALLRNLAKCEAVSGAGKKHLIDALHTHDKPARFASVLALSELGGDDAVEAISYVLLSDSEVGIRQLAAMALGMIKAPSSLSALVDALNTTQRPEDGNWVHSAAAEAMSQFEDPSVHPLPQELVKRDEPFKSLRKQRKKIPRAVAAALGWLGDPRGSKILKRMLKSSDSRVRSAAEQALERLEYTN